LSGVGLFGGRPTVRFEPASQGDALSVPFRVEEDGRYAVRLIAFASEDAPMFDTYIDDGAALKDVDLKEVEAEQRDLLLGTFELDSGTHRLVLKISTPDDCKGSLSLELLKILRLPPEARREVRTHNEAHFIRLGIGRAVYAYRLAYGRVPANLEVLVETGIMSERYLRDENGYPLSSTCDGSWLHVTSGADGGWSHRWCGGDARR
jgi:hypothetical protein